MYLYFVFFIQIWCCLAAAFFSGWILLGILNGLLGRKWEVELISLFFFSFLVTLLPAVGFCCLVSLRGICV